LNGASSGGILVTPVLVLAIERYGFTEALVGSATIMALVMLPAITLWVRRPHDPATARPAANQPASWTRKRALRSAAFWSVAAPFAMALTAQVGFLVHQIAALEPVIGRTQAALSVAALTVCAILGRFGLGGFAKHLDMRRFAAWSIASQALALIAFTITTNSAALMAACMVFGLSAGNLLSLPTLVIQREFEAASFGMLVGLSWAISQFTYAFGPGVMGVIRDMTGAYTAPILLCAALDVAAAATILLSRPRSI
jgi:predicted MFS family arabinose efflux permease